MSRAVLLCVIALALFVPASAVQRRARQQKGAVCGDPTAPCRPGAYEFKPYDLPFRIARNAVIWESEEFYAVILKSLRDESEDGSVFVPEDERLAAQKLFPRNKVFTSRAGEPGDIYYSNIGLEYQIMAVYAGRTRAEAQSTLEKVKATGRFPGAYLRRMHVGFNGT